MRDTFSTPLALGQALAAQRRQAGLSIKAVAERAGKSRAVVYRLERGEESSVSSLLAVLGALKLAVRLEGAELPTLAETAGFFDEEDDDADAAGEDGGRDGPAA